MFHHLKDFLDTWKNESEATIKLFSNLTDASLQQRIDDEGRKLGRLANHIIETLTEMPHRLGLPIEEQQPAYDTASELVAAYEAASQHLVKALVENWKDETLEMETNMYGSMWKNGFSLFVIITHQAHHRGQMTVLMRQAGLVVPGMYGPSREEWALMNMPAMV